jgi:cell division protein FtsL
MKTDIQEKIIRSYLLGDLPEAEQLALVQEFFADDEMFEQVWATENDLLDQYIRGKLTLVEKDLFEKNYLASDVHRQRLAFAQTLIFNADSPAQSQTIPAETQQSVSWWAAVSRLFRGNLVQWGMVAAMLLVIGGSIWLYTERARLRQQMNQLEEARVAEQQRAEELERKITEERKHSEELAAELERLRQEQAKQATQTLPNQVIPRSVVSLLLSPMILRSEGETAPLKITGETTTVRLQLKIQEPAARNFRVSLRTVEGTQVWNGSAGKKGGTTVSVLIPASKLSTNDYILTLTASGSTDQPQESGRYFFRILKQ